MLTISVRILVNRRLSFGGVKSYIWIFNCEGSVPQSLCCSRVNFRTPVFGRTLLGCWLHEEKSLIQCPSLHRPQALSLVPSEYQSCSNHKDLNLSQNLQRLLQYLLTSWSCASGSLLTSTDILLSCRLIQSFKRVIFMFHQAFKNIT